jgi:hypothetical protein
MAGPYIPILALNRSQQLRIGNAQGGVGGNKVPQELGNDIKASGGLSQPFYVDLSVPENRRDLQRHGALGAYIVVGSITNTNVNPVVASGGQVTPGTGVSVNVAAGTLHNRLTGADVDGASAANDGLTLTTTSGQSQVFLISWNNTTGAVQVTAGTPATTGSEVAPATPSQSTPLATVDLANGAASVTAGNITDVRPQA